MLHIDHISKTYRTGELVQTALDDVTLDLRDNEFVAVLGPSGSGKTTLLNVIGGLDRYDSGDLIINGTSTKQYKDRDWDTYRNHTIGFVFQSYNLIGHQSVLSNVELALTIGGISRKERRRRAIAALEEVGLGDQIKKRPNQLSGGQMQRVAIARALVGDPDILLADEPTGALDSVTSLQIMELLKEVARNRLVVMVTHNPELAENYATRIIRLKDGRIIGDSDPCHDGERSLAIPGAAAAKTGKASMSWGTSLALSFSNLRTKLGRTLLTAFAGSIGIIGIALILSLSTGADQYIKDIQRDTMTSYPISIQATTIDLSGLISAAEERRGGTEELTHERDQIYANNLWVEMRSSITNSLTENNLTDFKHYLDEPDSSIHEYLGENGVIYSYDVKFGVYTYDTENVFINTDGVKIGGRNRMGGSSAMRSSMSSFYGGGGSAHFSEMLPDKDTGLVNAAVKENYDLLYGRWPEKADELILILDTSNEISLNILYQLGFLPSAEYLDMLEKLDKGEEVKAEDHSWSYEAAAEREYYLLPACDQYEETKDGLFRYIGDDADALEKALDKAYKLKIVGVVRSSEESMSSLLTGPLGYTQLLTNEIIRHTEESAVVKAQKASPDTSVLNGLRFAPDNDAAKAEDARVYLQGLNTSEKAAMYLSLMRPLYADQPEMLAQLSQMSEAELAAGLDAALGTTITEETLVGIYDAYISTGTYDENMSDFGWVSPDAPSGIDLYCDSFEDKDGVAKAIEEYNNGVEEKDQITYTDYVGLLMNSVTTIINVISGVLIAFVAVSLVVSSIMIGIITYISVLERTKEIGVLRALGASKRNVSQVFNAETLIIGFTAGLMGIGISELILIPGNMVIRSLTGAADVKAFIRPEHALFLILLSTVLTLIGGIIPARAAARRDPVAALRTE